MSDDRSGEEQSSGPPPPPVIPEEDRIYLFSQPDGVYGKIRESWSYSGDHSRTHTTSRVSEAEAVARPGWPDDRGCFPDVSPGCRGI
ncbi:hypothetical protein OROMI_003284 [Orobanche minor]